MKTMRVRGIEITEAMQQAAVLEMRRAKFTAPNIYAAMVSAEMLDKAEMLPGDVRRVAVSRLIQRERKAGNIEWNGFIWKWVGPK